MTDEGIKRAAQHLRTIEHHEGQIRELSNRIVGHQYEMQKERAAIDKLQRGEPCDNHFFGQRQSDASGEYMLCKICLSRREI